MCTTEELEVLSWALVAQAVGRGRLNGLCEHAEGRIYGFRQG